MANTKRKKNITKFEDMRNGAGCALFVAVPLGVAAFVFVLLFSLSLFIETIIERSPAWALSPFTFALSIPLMIFAGWLIFYAVKQNRIAKILEVDHLIISAADDDNHISLSKLVIDSPVPIEKIHNRLNVLVTEGIIELEIRDDGNYFYKIIVAPSMKPE